MVNEDSQKSKMIETPSISLPKGGGAIQGMGENFSANPVTGTGSMNIPLKITQGRGGFTPQLSLSYDSGSGNGSFGFGWSLSLPSITRKTNKGLPQYRDRTDVFLLAGSEDLVPLLDYEDPYTDVIWKRVFYKPRIEGLFSRIEKWSNGDDTHWRVISKENITSVYGKSENSRIVSPDDTSKIFSWLLSESYDAKGNVISYVYETDVLNTNRYISEIRYGNEISKLRKTDLEEQKWHFKIKFEYMAREDSFSTYRSGFEIRNTFLCDKIKMFHNFEKLGDEDFLVSSTNFTYDENKIASFLLEAQHIGHNNDSSKSLPPLEFTYSKAIIDKRISTIDIDSMQNLPMGVDGREYSWIDLYSEGLSGVLYKNQNTWYYKENLGNGTLGKANTISSFPTFSDNQQLLDLDGDGVLELVSYKNDVSGFYEKDSHGNWEIFKSFQSKPNIDWDDPNLKFVDVTGDGHADILISGENIFTWYASKAKEGFESAEKIAVLFDEEQEPALVFSDTTESIYLADFSGDGLNDIVRIRNGEVCYWSNLGYGRFGAKKIMKNSPWFDYPDLFNQQNIRLSDIDGSGVVDIVYLKGKEVNLYFNESGNSWSEKEVLTNLPNIDNLSSVNVVDLKGNGTACLVWSSSLPSEKHRLHYIDLMGGQKPYLLTESKNNLGLNTKLEYVSSTKFYLNDKANNEPWITKLPFPVHVVEKVTLEDKWRETKFTTTYSYHHGYFDSIEREFRGFGRVEQIDSESFGTFKKLNSGSPYISNETLYQAPIKTVTWFHTGAFLQNKRILNHFEKEYFQHKEGAFKEKVLDEPNIDSLTLSTTEYIEALRACKGMMLRQEVYELDVQSLEQGEHKAVKLFSTSNHNVKIQCLQKKGTNEHAIFLVKESESLVYHYELDLEKEALLPDPRIAHTFNLEIDEYGNILKSMSVVYPRLGQYKDETLSSKTNELINSVQKELHIRYSNMSYTNMVNYEENHHLPLLATTKQYEVTGLVPQESYLTLEEVLTWKIEEIETIEYYNKAQKDKAQKRIIEENYVLYFKENLTEPLGKGELNHLALPYETYTLALTDNLLGTIFENKKDDIYDDLRDSQKSGYLYENGNFWIRSGIVGFEDDAEDHYFLPERYIDAFSNVTTLKFDATDMFIESSTNALGHTTSIKKFDYRTLQPLEMKDINDNLSEVVFDELGMPIAIALKGKGSEADSLESFQSNIQEHKDLFFEKYNEERAKNILQKATACYIYDFGDETQPASATTIVRETHDSTETRVQTSFEYSDGLGKVLVKKVQAEPEENGSALRWIANGKTILNNKGKAVKEFEPYFSTQEHKYEELEEVGVSSIITYDSLERVVHTLMPDGSFSRTIYTPWDVKYYDQNDTILEDGNEWGREQEILEQTEKHANTPKQVFLDALGREVISVEENLNREKSVTYTKLDAEGKPLWVEDARHNLVMQYVYPIDNKNEFSPTYDIAGNLLFEHSMDSGNRWLINDAVQKPFYAWSDDKNDATLMMITHREYDALHRPLIKKLKRGDNSWLTIEKFVYGEDKEKNLCGEVFEHYDSAGVVRNISFDFKGNLLKGEKQFVLDCTKEFTDWVDRSLVHLNDEVFRIETSYDALNRIRSLTNWYLEERDASIYTPTYNERGLLKSELFRLNNKKTEVIKNITYDAKGQRQTLVLGNGTETTYTYDPLTFRLKSMITKNDNHTFQNLSYTYDPVGNITKIIDSSQDSIYFNNQEVKPENNYSYDALYRLIKATGRENNTNKAPTSINQSQILPNIPNNNQTLRNYTEVYEYDAVGNILKVEHDGGTHGSWTRSYDYEEKSNRLKETKIANESITYHYDLHGNMKNVNNANNIEWNYDDMMHRFTLANGKVVHYNYDSQKERSRKTIINATENIKEERLYLGGMELYRRWKNDKLEEEIKTHHLMLEEERICMVEEVTETNNSNLEKAILYRYQYSNHLGSVGLELDAKAHVISYEEYHPYGTIAYQAKNKDIKATAKRYKYTGMERDEESGFSYHSARYYLPWLGRWLSADPIGIKGGGNIYEYSQSSPLLFHDKSGLNPSKSYSEIINNGVDFMTNSHGYYQGTSEIVLAEAQGYEVWNNQGKAFNHASQLENSITASKRKIKEINNFLSRNKLHGKKLNKLKNLRTLLQNHINLGEDTLSLAIDLKQKTPNRLKGKFGKMRGRNFSGLPSQQLSEVGVKLIPDEFKHQSESIVRRIKKLPFDAKIQKSLLNKTITKGSKKVLKGVARSIPIVGIIFALSDIQKDIKNKDYMHAGALILGGVFEPVDWAVTAYDIYDGISDSKEESSSKNNELNGLKNNELDNELPLFV